MKHKILCLLISIACLNIAHSSDRCNGNPTPQCSEVSTLQPCSTAYQTQGGNHNCTGKAGHCLPAKHHCHTH